jgi:hypothetical protein
MLRDPTFKSSHLGFVRPEGTTTSHQPLTASHGELREPHTGTPHDHNKYPTACFT